MNSRHYSDKQKYKEAGEQAARVIGEFMSIANDLSRKFGDGSPEHIPANDNTVHKSYSESGNVDSTSNHRNTDDVHNSATDEFQQAGEYLRELREAAGYSIDGFARAMNRQNAANKIESVEAGHDVFPNDWLDQISALLKQNDPMGFFDKLRSLYDANNSSEESADSNSRDQFRNKASDDYDSRVASSVTSSRRAKLNEIFTDETLEDLSDEQFEELSDFIKTNYLAALQLVGRRPSS